MTRVCCILCRQLQGREFLCKYAHYIWIFRRHMNSGQTASTTLLMMALTAYAIDVTQCCASLFLVASVSHSSALKFRNFSELIPDYTASHPRLQEINGNELGWKFVQHTLSSLAAFEEKTWRLVNLQVGGGGGLLSCLEPGINWDPYLISRHTQPTDVTSELRFLFGVVATNLFSTFCETGSTPKCSNCVRKRTNPVVWFLSLEHEQCSLAWVSLNESVDSIRR
jgi:hypothetical protein